MVVGKEVATVQVELSATINSPTVIGVIVIGVIVSVSSFRCHRFDVIDDSSIERFSQTMKAFTSFSLSVYVIFAERLRHFR